MTTSEEVMKDLEKLGNTALAVKRQRDEAIKVLKAALSQTGCDGSLCFYEWHEDARRIIADVEGE